MTMNTCHVAGKAKELNCKFYFAEFKIEIATHSDGRVVSCVLVTAAKHQK